MNRDHAQSIGTLTTLATPNIQRLEPWLVSADDTSPAARFAWLCARTVLPTHIEQNVCTLAARLTPNEWGQVLHIAETGGLSPLIYWHASRLGLLALMPGPVVTTLTETYRETLVTNLYLQHQQGTIVRTLEDQNLPVIPLKGISLTARYYGRLGIRPISDIDLLARWRDLPQVDQVLRGLGYRPASGPMPLWNLDALSHGEYSYVDPMGTKIELHWELTHRPIYRDGLSARAAWMRARTIEVNGQSVWCLSVSDELRFLCVHCAAGHYNTAPPHIRPIWLVDIAQLLRSLPAHWDWEGFIHDTVALHLATPVLIALSHCEAYLDVALPAGTLDMLRRAADSPVERRAWRTTRADLFVIDGFQAYLASMDTLAQKAAFLLGIALPSPTWIRRHSYRAAGTRTLWKVYVRYYTHLLRRIPKYVIWLKRRNDSSQWSSKVSS